MQHPFHRLPIELVRIVPRSTQAILQTLSPRLLKENKRGQARTGHDKIDPATMVGNWPPSSKVGCALFTQSAIAYPPRERQQTDVPLYQEQRALNRADSYRAESSRCPIASRTAATNAH